jgi:hypothetical protein
VSRAWISNFNTEGILKKLLPLIRELQLTLGFKMSRKCAGQSDAAFINFDIVLIRFCTAEIWM